MTKKTADLADSIGIGLGALAGLCAMSREFVAMWSLVALALVLFAVCTVSDVRGALRRRRSDADLDTQNRVEPQS